MNALDVDKALDSGRASTCQQKRIGLHYSNTRFFPLVCSDLPRLFIHVLLLFLSICQSMPICVGPVLTALGELTFNK